MIDPVPQHLPTSARGRRACLAPMGVLAAAVAMAALVSVPGPAPRAPIDGRASLAAPPVVSIADPRSAEAPTASPPGPHGGPLSRWAWAPPPEEPPVPEPPVPEAPAPQVLAAESPAAERPTQGPIEAPRVAAGPMTVPLPVPRPPELRRLGEAPRRAERSARAQIAPPPAPAATDERTFLEKLFGVEPTPARAYAALESRPADLTPRPRVSPPLAPPSARAEGGTAVYNILARTVTLPSGERLEAHSGLGASMDDPRHVHVRMRGPTPPGTYALTEREQPFHGVRAIRLTPVGGPEAIHGRVGLLAHTYMLGPSGASNGCVSFRDYDRFLQAYLRGEVQRLVVVSGAGDTLPGMAAAPGAPVRVARAGD